MNTEEEVWLEKVSKEATDSILSSHGGIAPFDVPALIIRPNFEYNLFADEPLRIIGAAVRLAIATVIQHSAMIPDNLDSFFARACRSTFDRLKMAPVWNYIANNSHPCDADSGDLIERGFDSILDLRVTSEIGVPLNRLHPVMPEDQNDKVPVYPQTFGMHQLHELEISFPKSEESDELKKIANTIIKSFIDFTEEVMGLPIKYPDGDECRQALITIRLGFITKIGKYRQKLLLEQFFDPTGEHAVILEYIHKRLVEILTQTKDHIRFLQ